MNSRRSFLQLVAGGSLCLAAPPTNSTAKQLRGVFPIAQTPFTDSDKLDIHSLAEQLRFIDRGGVHGFVWPQLASEWSSLTESERMAGDEAPWAAAKKMKAPRRLWADRPNLEPAAPCTIPDEEG